MRSAGKVTPSGGEQELRENRQYEESPIRLKGAGKVGQPLQSAEQHSFKADSTNCGLG